MGGICPVCWNQVVWTGYSLIRYREEMRGYMKIVADRNIPMVEQAFSTFGVVDQMDGRAIDRRAVAEADIVLVRSITKVHEELLNGSAVKFVATATIGTDHVDTSWLQEQGIGFANAPGSNALSVAQYVICALLSLKNNILKPLRDLTVGVVGVGNVGSRVATLVHALGARTLLCDPPRKTAEGLLNFVDLETVLEQSDVVTLHVPLTTAGRWPTVAMAGKPFFERLRSGAVLMNTSRGGVVNEAALVRHRDALAGLVLDVWAGEPNPDPMLVDSADIATPHIAGYSYDGKLAGTQMIYDAACRFFGKVPRFDTLSLAVDSPAVVDVTRESDPIAAAVHAAYDIDADSLALKSYCALSRETRRGYFDRLRREYPRRLEFQHFHARADSEHGPVLAALGFNVGSSSRDARPYVPAGKRRT